MLRTLPTVCDMTGMVDYRSIGRAAKDNRRKRICWSHYPTSQCKSTELSI